MISKYEMGCGEATWHWIKIEGNTHRVYESQIDPRRRYHSISLSLLAYSARSSVAEAGGARRRLREMNSMKRTTINGLFVRSCALRSATSKEATLQRLDTYFGQLLV
jgi:hypothetical protein